MLMIKDQTQHILHQTTYMILSFIYQETY